MMTEPQLKTIAVDLTPILPGGENGGAKVFVLELLRVLSRMVPETQFIVLTQAASHEELSSMDSANVSRRMVMGPLVQATMRPGLDSLARRLLPHLPRRLRGVATGLGYRINVALKRSGSSTLLGDMGVDLLFCPLTAPTFFESGIPTVCTIYDLQYRTYPEFFAPEDVARRERTFLEACRRATMLAAISDYSRNSAIDHANLDPKRIRTIYLRMARRFEREDASDSDNTILNRLGLIAQRYLIYPANFWKHKNHEMLLTAFGIACREGLPADIKLVCTGEPGARQEWLIRAAGAMDLEHRVLFPGFLTNEDLADLMASSAAVVFPSLYEGFGLPVIEAMAAGVPVGCSSTTSLPEVAADAALLFDPRVPTQIAGTIVRLVEDESTRKRLIPSGSKRAAEFADPERMARDYWELFLEAMRLPVQNAQLSGVHPDGWCAASLILHLPASDRERTLLLDLTVPAWLPASTVEVRTIQSDTSRASTNHLARGEEKELAIPIRRGVKKMTMLISPTFVPSRQGFGEDSRELSIMVNRIAISDETDTLETLYPEAPDCMDAGAPGTALKSSITS